MQTTSTSSFYGPVDDGQRERSLTAYLGYLNERNGALDRTTGTLPHRETGLKTMDASDVRFQGALSQSDFDRLYTRFDPQDAALTPEMLVLLTFCRMNAGEAYGVKVVKAVQEKRNAGRNDLPTRVIQFAQEEEEYHTRILLGASHHFDIRVTGEYKPKLALKVLIHALAYSPKPFFHPILYGSEVTGVFVFNWTLGKVREFIKDPVLREVLEQRLLEILVDEVGHVAFNRLMLSERARKVGQFFAGQTIKGMTMITPELSALGFDKNVERAFADFDIQQLPAEVLRRGFFA